MTHTHFSFGAHLAERRHLFTPENITLLAGAETFWDKSNTPQQRLALANKIATAFEIPNSERTDRNRLYDIATFIRVTVARIRTIDEFQFTVGTPVIYQKIWDGKPVGESVKTKIRLIQTDFLLRLEDVPGAISPHDVTLMVNDAEDT
jgi:hypothetical protein